MITLTNLSFAYPGKPLFRDLNLEVKENQVLMITGINGVGKSTLLRLMAGVLLPSSGEITYGEGIQKQPKRHIGFISDRLSLYRSMTVGQAIAFHRLFYENPRFDDRLIRQARVNHSQRVADLSKGQRVLLQLSLIMLAGPRVLLIDEIIHSIDVYLRDIFLRYLVELLDDHPLTLVMVNLNFTDIEGLLERVILLRDGEIVVDEEIEALKARVKLVTSALPQLELPTVFTRREADFYEHYVYPFPSNHRPPGPGQVVDLDLTRIVRAFIGGEYQSNEGE